ncbi:TadE/TadG family type IV pilus assembly protein [Nonomuraea pusilla]|uniref:TadE-like protein n=1 Tax=Nonomuraea pusilla TaxID=46177 RepID=A0A1H7V7A8_9ACTN|nr:TadE/TadG family type IV pilus assembly protein [Nonomuraea pusilla]SEM04715.1 TadE-like protein [Nonomuraea pusilla]
MTARGRAGRARPRPAGRERGATVVELALLMPVVLAVVLLIVQVALWFHGRQVAEAAAREGARVARAAPFDSGDWEGAARAKAEDVVHAIGPRLLSGARATTSERDPDQRWVTVTGSAVQVIPLLPDLSFTITATSGGPVECFRPDDGGDDCG